jgi:hypothetical protein
MRVKPPKTVLSMRPQVQAGKSCGSIFVLLTKQLLGKCRNEECGESFETKFPNQEFCSKKCYYRRQRMRLKARKARKSA